MSHASWYLRVANYLPLFEAINTQLSIPIVPGNIIKNRKYVYLVKPIVPSATIRHDSQSQLLPAVEMRIKMTSMMALYSYADASERYVGGRDKQLGCLMEYAALGYRQANYIPGHDEEWWTSEPTGHACIDPKTGDTIWLSIRGAMLLLADQGLTKSRTVVGRFTVSNPSVQYGYATWSEWLKVRRGH